MVRLLTRFDAPSIENADAFLRLLEAVQQTVGGEPGYVCYRLYRARENPLVLFADEKWRTQEDADAHVARATKGADAEAAFALLARPADTLTLVEVAPEDRA